VYSDSSGGHMTASFSNHGANPIYYYYNGSQLNEVRAPSSDIYFIYEGNNLTQVIDFAMPDPYTTSGSAEKRVIYGYDAQNRLSSVTLDLSPADGGTWDGNSITTTYTYDGTSTRVASISQTGGARLDIAYVQVGGTYRVASYTQAQSTGVSSTTAFSYDIVNNITSVIDNTGQETRLTYDSQGNLTRVEQMPTALGWTPQFDQWIQNADGSFTRQGNWLAGSVLSTASYANADISANITSSTNAVAVGLYDPVSGKAWDIYAYGSDSAGSGHIMLGNLYFPFGSGPGGATDISYNDGSPSFAPGDKLSLRWVNGVLHGFQNDIDLGAVPNGPPAGTKLKVFLAGFQDGATLRNVALSQTSAPGVSPQVSTFTYDTAGRVTSAIDPLGNLTTYSYDTNGNLTLKRDGAGNTSSFTYNSDNQVLTATDYLVPDPDGDGSATPSQPRTTRYVYKEGNLCYEISPEGRVTLYIYGAYNLLQATRVFDNTYGTSDLYDTSNLGPTDSVALSDVESWFLSLPDRSGTHTTNYVYDFRGNLSTVTSWAQVTTYGAGQTSGAYARTTYVYDAFGNLLSKVDNRTGGGSETFLYDSLNRLIGSTDLAGATTSIVYNDATNSQVITSSNGVTVTKVFDLAGELISITSSGQGNDVTADHTSEAYDNLGQLRMQTDALGNKTYYLYDADGRRVADISADGAITEYVYDADGRVTRTVSYATRLTAAQIASLTDSQGQPAAVNVSAVRPATNTSDRNTWTIYDAAGRVIETIDPAGHATVYSYDGASQLVGTTQYYTALNIAALKASPPTSLTLPATNAKDVSTRSFYDKDGNLIGSLDALGTFTESSYDAAGWRVSTIVHANPASAGLRASGTFAQIQADVGTSSLDRRTSYVFDNKGALRFEIDAQGRVTGFDYDDQGNLTTTSVYNTPIPAATNYSVAYVQAHLSPANARVTYDIYQNGKKAVTIDPSGQVTAFTYKNGVLAATRAYATLYDAANNGVSASAFLASPFPVAASADDRITRVYTDSANRPIYEVDAAGYVTQTQYDTEWRVSSVTRYPNPVSVNDTTTTADIAAMLNPVAPGRSVTQYTYDADGRIDTMIDPAGSVTKYIYDAFGQATDIIVAYGTAAASTTHRTFDQAGRELSITIGWGTAAAATTSYSYDAFGNALTVTDPDNNVTLNGYDILGRLISVTDPLNNVVSYQYDVFGNRVKATDQRGNSSYSYYDAFGRLTLQVDAEGYATATAYNNFDEISSVTHYMTKVAGGYDISTPPAIITSLADQITSFTRDVLGRVTSVTDAEQATESYTLNAFGDRILAISKLGAKTVNVFDHRGLLQSETRAIEQDANGNVTKSVTNTFQYDALGHRVQMVEAAGLPEQRTTNYKYDAAGRLTDTIGQAFDVLNPDGVTTTSTAPDDHYVYDLRGNVIEHDDAAGARTLSYYDAANNKVAEINPLGRLTTYTFDANGNVTTSCVYGDAVALPATPGGTPPLPVNGSNYRATGYQYDKNNRLLTTYHDNVSFGYQGSPNYVYGTGRITVSNAYDAAGNLVVQQDGQPGNLAGQIIYFYDRNGHKIGQVDQANYLTTYDLDADGNVITETRYANALSGSVSPTNDLNALKTAAGASADNRITTFTYDHDGRRLSETRLNVEAWSTDANGANISQITTNGHGSADATIHYTYNALGLVTKKVEANGDYVDYSFDLMGRMTRVQKTPYQDFTGTTGTTVRPTTDMEYDGTDHLVRQIVRGTDDTTENDDRITTYSYDAAGHVTATTDPTTFTTNSWYDANGRLIGQTYLRNGITEGEFYTYDLAGNQISQKKGTLNNGVWTFARTTNMLYDVYGEMVARGTNANPGDPTSFQEFADYDNLGRVWRTNFGDGVTKAYCYDGNGNATLLLQPINGSDLRSMTLDAMVQTGSGVTKTISIFDKRNQLVETRQPSIENATDLPDHINDLPTTTAGTNYSAGTVTITQPSGSSNPGSTAGETPNIAASGTTTVSSVAQYQTWSNGQVTSYSLKTTVSIPTAYGSGTIYLKDDTGNTTYASATPAGSSVDLWDSGLSGSVRRSYFIWQQVGTSQVLIGRITGPNPSTSNPVTVTLPSILEITGLNDDKNHPGSMKLMARRSNSSDAYQDVSASRAYATDGGYIAGWYVNMTDPPFNSTAGQSQNWDLKYYFFDNAGNVTDSQNASLTVSASGVGTITAQSTNQIGGTGKVILTTAGLVFSELPAGTSALSGTRIDSSGNATTFTASQSGSLFTVNTAGWTGTYTLHIALNGSNTPSLQTTFTAGSQPSYQLSTYSDPLVNFGGSNWGGATTVKLWYKLTSSGSWTGQVNLTNVGGNWVWDTAAIWPTSGSATYDFQTEVDGAGGQIISITQGQVKLGAGATPISHYAINPDSEVEFTSPSSSATTMVLLYRTAGSTGSYTSVTLGKSGNVFALDADAYGLRGSVDKTYEFLYDVYDSSGHLIPPVGGDQHAKGTFTVHPTRSTQIDQLKWVVSLPPTAAAVIDRTQSYNAFGEISSETDGLNHTINLSYNTMGKLITKQSPETTVTNPDGSTVRARPTERYRYDLAGRLIGTIDANQHLNTLVLLAGSGEEDGEQAITIAERHADAGQRYYRVDIFGDVRSITDELSNVTLQSYDADGRLTQVIHPTRTTGTYAGGHLVDSYQYDGLGERTGHTETFAGTSQSEGTAFDVLGRVISTTDLAGLVTGYSYAWSTAMANAGMGVSGAWVKTTTTNSTRTSTETDDYFGRIVAKNDLSGRNFTYSYNRAGDLIQQTGTTSGESISYLYYGNGYVRSITDNTLGVVSTFEYDKEGNRTVEDYSSTATDATRQTYEHAQIRFDELNRVIEIADPEADIKYQYDDKGNRMRIYSDYSDGLNGNHQIQDYWYAYDSMDRFTITMGTLSGNQVIVGSYGHLIGYNAANERMSAVNGSDGTTETYTYSTDGYLETTSITDSSHTIPVVRATRDNDLLGRVETYTEKDWNGGNTFIQRNWYDGDNRVTSRNQQSKDPTFGTWSNDQLTNNYSGTYNGVVADQGVLMSSHDVINTSTTQDTAYTYDWWDEAKQTRMQISMNGGAYSNAQGMSQFTYDVNGHMSGAFITGGGGGSISYVNDAYGQVLRREQKTGGGVLGPREYYYYFDGNRVGEVGNNGPVRVDYAEALALRSKGPKEPGQYRYGAPVASADFDQNYEPIGPNYPGQAASQYTVRSGDTLQSIAQTVWGDSSMWYLIADANGLTASDSLPAGEILIIPNKVTNIHNRAGVYRVYDPGEAIGDAMPILPPQAVPPAHHHGGCGAVGEILLIVVAVAVTAVTAGAAIAAASPVEMTLGQGIAAFAAGGAGTELSAGALIGIGAAAGAAGSIVSQGVGVATGIQDHFSFGGVALAAVAGGIAGGVGASGLDKVLGVSGFAAGAVNGAVSNALTQSVGVATGLQGSFDWAGVATAGIAGGIGRSLHISGLSGFDRYVADGLTGGAAAVAAAATRSLLTGTDFGDTLQASLPDIVSSSITNIAADLVSSGSLRPTSQSPGNPSTQSGTTMSPAGPTTPSVADDNLATLLETGLIGLGSPLQINPLIADATVAVPAVPLYTGYYGPSGPVESDGTIDVIGPRINRVGRIFDTFSNIYGGRQADFSLTNYRSLYNDLPITPWGTNYTDGVHDYVSREALVKARPEFGYSFVNPPSPQRAYEIARGEAFIDSIGADPFGAGTIAYAMGASPSTIKATTALGQNVGDLATAAYVSGAVGRPSSPAAGPMAVAELNQYYPPNSGFLGSSSPSTLQPGTLLDRYGGSDFSDFFSPVGVPVGMRALPPGVADKPLRTFRVDRTFTVDAGLVAPYYNQPGYGTQYKTPMQLKQMLSEGYLSELKR